MANDKDFKVKNGLDVGSTVTLQAYGQGNNTGTAAKILAVDSSGNLIEEAPSAGGGLANVVEDISPQLGGSLDVNGNSIVSVSGGDIAITPDADGQIVLDGLNWPISDGTDRQVLVTDGSGELTFDDIPPVQVAATNNTGSSIAAGTPVYQAGVSGQNITIEPADASSASTMPAIGVTKGAISASGGTGVVVVSGFLKGINTSAYTAGDTLYVANGGGFVTSPPDGETVLIENLGKVVKSDASAGSIIVTGAGRANATPNLNDGNFFLGNSSNQAVPADFTGSIDSHLNQANPTDGYVLSWTSGDYAWVAGGGGVQSEEHPTVTNGSATVTLSASRTLSQIEVYLNGVKLRGGTTLGGTTEWTVSGTTLTFNQNLSTGDEVTVVSLTSASTVAVTDLSDTNVTGVADGELLKFDNSTSKYVPTSMVEDSSGNVDITGAVSSTVGTNDRTFIATDGTQYVSLVADLSTGGYNGLSTAGDVGIIFTTDNNSASDESGKGLVIGPWTSGPNGIKIQENGNVGIGTSSPSGPIDVVSNVNGVAQRIRARSTDEYGLLEFVENDGSTAHAYIGTPAADTLAFFTNGLNERMRINSSGELLLGTTGGIGSGKLVVNYASASSRGIVTKTDTTSTTAHIQFQNTNTINNVVGEITTNGGSTSYGTSSDYRLKENVVDLTSAIERLKLIPVHRFNFIADPDTTVDGFLAHEVQPHVPEAVTGEKDAVDENGDIKPQGIDQSKLVPLLTAAIQEQQTQIEAQQATIEALEARLTALEGA